MALPVTSGLNLNVIGSTIGVSDGVSVTTWPDQSGSGNDLTGSSNKPIYYTSGSEDSKPFVSFTPGILDNTSYSVDKQAFTLFGVLDLQNVDGAHYIFTIGSNPDFVIFDEDNKISTFKGSTVASSVIVPTQKRFAIAITFDASNVTVYIDSISTTVTRTAFTAGSLTGFTIGGSGPFNGRMFELACYSRALNSTELGQLFTYGTSTYGTGSSQNIPSGHIVFDGDSTIFGLAGTRNRNIQTALSLNTLWHGHNFGLSGQTITNMLSDQSEITSDYANGSNWLILEAGYNDLSAGDSGSTIEGRLATYCNTAISAGFSKDHIVVQTLSTANTGTGGARDTANTLIRNNYTGYAGWLIDQALDADIGVTGGSFNNASYYADGVHKNDSGYQKQAALIRSVLGSSFPGDTPTYRTLLRLRLKA